jgi:hypothetical protein
MWYMCILVIEMDCQSAKFTISDLRAIVDIEDKGYNLYFKRIFYSRLIDLSVVSLG